MTSCGPTFVASIHFGTNTCTITYAKISHNTLIDVVLLELDKNKPKTETIVALDVTQPKGRQCVAFGSRAKYDENLFFSHILIFENLKKLVNNNSNGYEELCNAHNGKTKPLSEVIGETLNYLVNRIVKEISLQTKTSITKKDILWVLTVPEIWNWKAKSFMRNVMRDYAEIDDKYIIEALEPECALITLCQETPEIVDQTKTVMIVDIGGTVVISVHELNYKKELVRKLESREGDWGGQNLDRSFFKLLQDVLNFDFNSFKFKECGDYFDLTANIEDLKIGFSKDFDLRDYKDKNVNLSLNYEQIKYSIVKRIEEYKERTKTKQIDSLQRKYGIKISYQILYELYMNILQNITSAMNDILTSLSKKNIFIDLVYLMGGMAEAKIVVDEIKTSFKNKQFVTNPRTAIIKGAVYYGIKQNAIEARFSSFTYGLSANTPFIPEIHDITRKIFNFKKEIMCRDCFLEIVKVGQKVNLNQSKSVIVTPIYEDQTAILFNILQTKKINPKYADERDVEKLTSITIDISDCMHLPIEKRTVTVNFMFGATIIYINAINEATGKQENIYIPFDYTFTKLSPTEFANQKQDLSCKDIIGEYKNFSNAINRIKDIPEKHLYSYAILAKYLTEAFNTVEEKARVIYLWITHNIENDVLTYGTNLYHTDPIKTFKERKGVCGGYATLFQAMMFHCGVLSTVKVNGISKSIDSTVRSHTWNALQLESGKYILIDCSLGAGTINISSGLFEKRFNPNFFFVNPKTLIATHLPDNDKWQFLDQTVTLTEFIDMPVITQHGVNNGVTLISERGI